MRSGRETISVPRDLDSYVVNIKDFTFCQQVTRTNDEIWIAVQSSTGKRCILKQLGDNKLDFQQENQFFEEIRAYKKCYSPFVAPLIGFTCSPPYCIIHEISEEFTLQAYLHSPGGQFSKLSGTQQTVIAMSLAYAMMKIHSSRLTEPDLNSSNIFLNHDYHPKICHFPTTSASPYLYKAPEIVSGGSYDYSADVFNYGMILYELLTKRVPFEKMTGTEINEAICVDKLRPPIPPTAPRHIQTLIQNCWAQNPSKRPTFEIIYQKFEKNKLSFFGTDQRVIQNLSSMIQQSENDKSPPKLNTLYNLNVNNSYRKRTNSTRSVTRTPRKFFNTDSSDVESVTYQPVSTLPQKTAKSYMHKIDLSVLENYNNPEFFEVLNKLDILVTDDQYYHVFNVFSGYFKANTPFDVLSSIFSVLPKLIDSEAAIKVFEDCRLFKFFPYDDTKLFDSILNTLFIAFERRPQIFQKDFERTMSLILNKNIEKGLILLCLFAKHFDKMEHPWVLLDLLFSYEKRFFQSSIGSEYLSFLYFLNSSYNTFYQTRISQSRTIFANFLSSNDKLAVATAYKAICALYDNLFQIPIECIVNDLSDPKLSMSVVSLLMRMDKLPKDPEVIFPLLSLAKEHVEATLILIKMLTESSVGQSMLLKPKWIFQELPTLRDTLRLIVTILKFKGLRSYLSSLKELPEFLVSLATSTEKDVVICLSSICKRLVPNKSLFISLAQNKFFVVLNQRLNEFHDDTISFAILDVIAQFAAIGYTKQYLLFGDSLKDFLYRGQRLSRGAFRTIYFLSFHSQCAQQFRSLEIHDDIIQLFVEDTDRKKVRELLENLDST